MEPHDFGNETTWQVLENHRMSLQKITLTRRTMEAIGRAGLF